MPKKTTRIPRGFGIGAVTITRERDQHDQAYYNVDAPPGYCWEPALHSKVAWDWNEAIHEAQEPLERCTEDCECLDN